MDSALTRIAAKLAELQAQGWEKHAHQFNVPAHRFALGPVTSVDAIAAFEAKHSIELPAELRAFVTSIAGSGAGPYHGLLPIERWDDFWDGELIGLCEQGCGYWTALSVTGPDRGRLFNMYGEQRTLVRDRSFLVWYERWLDELLAGIATSSFGWHRGGSEDELAAELAAATEIADQLDIITSLNGRPTVAPATLDLVAPLITSARHAVRTACCRVLSRDPRFTAAIVALLADPDLHVRIYAFHAFVARGVLGPLRARIAVEPHESLRAAIAKRLGD